MKEICPKTENCPLFKGEILQRDQSTNIYKVLFCEAGKEKYMTCKRYIASEKTGKPVPANILPNSSKSIDEIIEIINKN